MSAEANTATSTTEPHAPRPTGAVLAILAAVILVPLLAWLCMSVAGGSASSGGEDVVDGVRANRIQAVYLANDRVFFGDLEAGEGDWVRLRDAYYLRAAAAEGTKEGEEAPATSLVPVEQEVGGDGTLVLNSNEIVSVQNLAADAEITEAIEDARE